MFKNVATKIALFAFDTTTGAAKTGDAANITAYVSKDYGAVTVLGDTSATEMDATNAKGWYLFDVAQAEANADALLFTAKSTTANVAIVGQYIHTTPNRFSSLVIDAAGLADANAVKIGPTGAGTAQTARDVGASVLLAGDLTATMKTSVTTAATAATPTAAAVTGAVGSVTGNVGGNVAGTVASVVGNVGGNVVGTVASVVGAVGSVTGAVGSVTARVTANTDQLAGQTVTAAAGVTFPTSVASPTNITAGTISTVTNLTNAPTAGDLTATMKTSVTTAATASTPTAAAVTGAVGSVTGAVGSVTGNVGGSVASVVADVGITQAGADKVWGTTVRTLSSFGTLVSDTATAVWGAATRLLTAGTNIVLAKGVGVTGLNDLDASGVRGAVGLASANLDTQLGTISGYVDTEVGAIKTVTDKINDTLQQDGNSPLRWQFTSGALEHAPTGGSAPSAATIAGAVWDVVLSSHLTALSTGAALNAAGSSGDPWATALPGAYGAGTAGKIVGDNIDATISSRTKPADTQAAVTLVSTVTAVTGLTASDVGAIKAKTDNLPAAPAAVSDVPTTAQNADKLLGRTLAGGGDGGRMVKDALRSLRNKTSITAGTLTVTEEDDTTPAWTATVTTAAGDPLTSIDPA